MSSRRCCWATVSSSSWSPAPDRHRTLAAQGRAPGGAKAGSRLSQPVRCAVLAGGGDSGDRHGGGGDRVGRMGDQSALHGRCRRLHQRGDAGDPALSRVAVPGAPSRRRSHRGRHRPQRASPPRGPHPVRRLFRLAQQDARVQRRRADEERRRDARDRQRLGRAADRPAGSLRLPGRHRRGGALRVPGRRQCFRRHPRRFQGGRPVPLRCPRDRPACCESVGRRHQRHRRCFRGSRRTGTASNSVSPPSS